MKVPRYLTSASQAAGSHTSLDPDSNGPNVAAPGVDVNPTPIAIPNTATLMGHHTSTSRPIPLWRSIFTGERSHKSAI